MDIKILLDKVKNFGDKEKIDLSSQEDLAIGVMNLISIEEHLVFTYEKTKNDSFLELLNEIRGMRKELLEKIVKNPKGEIWCISKHFLAGSMRFIEVGTKKLKEGKEDEAKEMFDKAYSLWNMFWGLNLGLVNGADIADTDTDNTNAENSEIGIQGDNGKTKTKISPFEKLGKIIEKILDCCRE